MDKLKKRVRLRIEGRVQGVGFRPAIFRLARRLALTGFVNNTDFGVLIEIQGAQNALDAFLASLPSEKPRLAVIESVKAETRKPVASEKDFTVAESRRSGDVRAGLPPDLAICAACRQELFDRRHRRHQYPFINCTDCGPRFTIINELPYDRRRTSMADFQMCPDCAAEFHDPGNRRFEAQPNACPVCGPRVQLLDLRGRAISHDPLAKAVILLRQGKILALKGVGGYHLACDARNAAAVQRLRARKQRPHKPLAIMFRSLAQIREHCRVTPAEAAELSSVAAPVVILAKKTSRGLAGNLSPDTNDLGVFLPYAPLHCLLLEKISPLVMTSGNQLDEPMAIDEAGLKPMLGKIADAALIHDRRIVRRCDDSVLKFAHANSGNVKIMIRRSRGFVPGAIRLPVSAPPILACGAELKNVVCVTRGDQAFLSPHIGDLEDFRNYRFFQETTLAFIKLLEVRPAIIAYDLHPDYASTRFALAFKNVRHVAVQHHHAHIAACLAEHFLTEKVIGIALDGTGFGPDGTIWGGEIMLADLAAYERVGHFRQYPMPGGAQAILNPARMALSYLLSDAGPEAEAGLAELLPGLRPAEVRLFSELVRKRKHALLTSSAGRLFDAVAALLGFPGQISYEGQAAIRLQTLADRATRRSFPYQVRQENGLLVISFSDTIRAIIEELKRKTAPGAIAGRFHNTVAEALVSACAAIRERHGLERVALSGGVFQNDLLLARTMAGLENMKFKVYTSRLVPLNDAGIAFGQAAVAAAKNQGRDASPRHPTFQNRTARRAVPTSFVHRRRIRLWRKFPA